MKSVLKFLGIALLGIVAVPLVFVGAIVFMMYDCGKSFLDMVCGVPPSGPDC